MRPLQKKISSSNGKNFVVKYQLLILIKRDVHRAPYWRSWNRSRGRLVSTSWSRWIRAVIHLHSWPTPWGQFIYPLLLSFLLYKMGIRWSQSVVSKVQWDNKVKRLELSQDSNSCILFPRWQKEPLELRPGVKLCLSFSSQDIVFLSQRICEYSEERYSAEERVERKGKREGRGVME